MAAAYTWPASLPQQPTRDGYEESDGVKVISTPMDLGPPQTLLVGGAGATMVVPFIMSAAQLATLDAFLADDVRYVRPFNWRHPRTGATIEVKALPVGDGSFRSLSALGSGFYRVTLRLQVLP